MSAGFLSLRVPDAQALLLALAADRRQPARRKTMPSEIAAVLSSHGHDNAKPARREKKERMIHGMKTIPGAPRLFV